MLAAERGIFNMRITNSMRIHIWLGIYLAVQQTASGCFEQTFFTATEEPRSLFSPNYPQNYNNSLACGAVIFSNIQSSVIYVEVVDIDLDNTEGDCGDSLSFHDGVDASYPLISRLCGHSKPTLIKSKPVQALSFAFNTDSAYTRKGFALRYWTRKENSLHINYPQCTPGQPTIIAVTSLPQRLDLPDFQGHSSGSRTCDAILRAEGGSILVVKPVPGAGATDLDCDSENITLYDGESASGPPIPLWCREEGFTSIRSSGSSLLLRSHLSRDRQNGTQLGLIVYSESRVADVCDDREFPTFDVSFSPTYLWIPYKYSATGAPCPVAAVLRSVGPVSMVKLEVLASSSREPFNCSSSVLQASLYSDTMHFLLQPQCTADDRPYYLSETQQMVIGQTLDSQRYLVRVVTKGYTCDNETRDMQITGDDIQVTAMDFPVLPWQPSTTRCRLRFFSADSGNIIRLAITESSLSEGVGHSCAGNHILLRDGGNASSPSLGQYCGRGSTSQPVFTSTTNQLFLELVPRVLGQMVHVKIEYSSFADNRCNGTVRMKSSRREKFLESPGYPHALASNLQCQFLITSTTNTAVILELIMTDSVLPVDCSDNITVFDGNTTNADIIIQWCHSQNATVVSTGSDVLIQFASSPHSATSKFRIRYTDNAPRVGSPEDPTVVIAIGIIVGLANLVGVIVFVSYVIFKYRNRSTGGEDKAGLEEDNQGFEEKLEEAEEEVK